MDATRELIAALVAGGMDAADAAGLVARAALEMTVSLTHKSAGAIRQQRYRDRNKASRVTPEDQGAEAHVEASRTVTNRNESVTRYGVEENRPLIVEEKEEGLSSKKESKKERVSKKRNGPLPEDWQPPPRAFDVAAELSLTVPPIEARFRDYLKSSGKLYADHDAAFCNFIRMTPKFGGGHHGNAVSNNRPDTAAGRATARETQHVTAMGGAALRYLQRGEPAGAGRGISDDPDIAEVFDFKPRTENAG